MKNKNQKIKVNKGGHISSRLKDFDEIVLFEKPQALPLFIIYTK